ncbi:MAG: HAD-IA family hydrolase [Candidatus Bathyarchaeota archaeon]|nr:HAD family hydrolase [Candidatus Bathyarchaeota archaeon A05DMB-5]MDH7557149.1 HAD-IA family hydrolase [Candidatus Bathyarchaeota archaeon]
MIKAAVFDLDGTIIHLPIDYEKLFKEFSKIMKTEEVRPLTEKISKLDKKARERAFEVWDSFELEALRKFTVNKEGIMLFQRFSEIPKALVTMQGKKLVENITERLDLSFNFTITREDSLDRTKQLQKAAQMLEIHPQNILFVGNTNEDYLAAKKIGCQFVRVNK